MSISIILTGPSPPDTIHGAITGEIGTPIGPFSVQPNQALTGIVNLDDSAKTIPNNTTIFLLSSGVFSPSSLIFNNSNVPQYFYYTPMEMGLRPISISSSGNTVSAPVWIFANPLPPLIAGLPKCP